MNNFKTLRNILIWFGGVLLPLLIWIPTILPPISWECISGLGLSLMVSFAIIFFTVDRERKKIFLGILGVLTFIIIILFLIAPKIHYTISKDFILGYYSIAGSVTLVCVTNYFLATRKNPLSSN